MLTKLCYHLKPYLKKPLLYTVDFILKIENYKPAWFSWGKTMGSFLWVATELQSTVQTLPLAGKTLANIETKAM